MLYDIKYSYLIQLICKLSCDIKFSYLIQIIQAKTAVAIEYTDCISAAGKDPRNECPGYESKQSDGEVLVMLEIWGMQSALLFPLLPGPLWPKVVAPDRVLSMG